MEVELLRKVLETLSKDEKTKTKNLKRRVITWNYLITTQSFRDFLETHTEYYEELYVRYFQNVYDVEVEDLLLFAFLHRF